jgi:2-polyprenyl-3-methyl-5-hydroxy-6-metoxy-1,4-benzoquinol methylase
MGDSPDSRQRYDLELTQIIPEYHSRSAVVRWLFEKRVDVAADRVAELAPRRLIDVGCGEGYLFRVLARHRVSLQQAVGVDINPRVLELNGRLPGIRFATADLFAMPDVDGAHDVMVCLDVLEHVRDLGRALAELRRILADGGHLITSEPVESVLYKLLRFILKGTYSQEAGPGAGVHYHNARQIDAVVRDHGFARLRSTRIPFYAPLDLFHVNLYRKLPAACSSADAPTARP